MFVRFTLLCTMGQMGDGGYRFPLVQWTDPIEKGAFGGGCVAKSFDSCAS